MADQLISRNVHTCVCLTSDSFFHCKDNRFFRWKYTTLTPLINLLTSKESEYKTFYNEKHHDGGGIVLLIRLLNISMPN